MPRASESIGVADVGGSGGRVSTLTRRGKGYALDTVHEFAHPLHEMHLADRRGAIARRTYWNPWLIYNGMLDGLRRAATGENRNIVSFGLDSWGSDGVWVAESGDMLLPAYSCHCDRFAEAREELEALLPGRERYRLTGVYPDGFLVVNQVYWAARRMPQVVALADVFLPLVSLYNFWFSGVRAMEYSWLTTGHLGSSISGGYCEEIFTRLALPRDKMPPLRRQGEELGVTPAGLAESLGLAPFKILLPSNHDTACAFAAAPVVPGRPALVVSAGTWWCMGTPLPEAVASEQAYAAHFSNVAGVEGVALNVISMGSMPAQALRRRWEWEDGRAMAWEEYDRLAAAAWNGNLRFNIDDPRLRVDADMPRVVAEVAGIPPEKAERGLLAALVYAGLAGKTARLAASLGEIIGRRIEEILVIGGGARNNLLNQWLADVSGLPVRTGPANATSLGNALTQAVTLGWFGSLAEGREALRGLWEEKIFLPGRRA